MKPATLSRQAGLIAAIALTGLATACRTPAPNGITQVATIDALLSGVYDGHMSLKDLRRHGDFGIGTFEGLDGEMILLDGAFYQVRADGKVYRASPAARTPFACVTTFCPDLQVTITNNTDLPALEQAINGLVPSTNRFCAFLVRGSFSRVLTRSVPAQKKPYLPLAQVTKTQPTFALSDLRGTLVGFRSPPFVKGVNVPGYHLHFLADDRSGGGHVLSFEMTDGVLSADTIHEWLRVFIPPDSTSFGAADLSRDRSRELDAVEKQSRPSGHNKP